MAHAVVPDNWEIDYLSSGVKNNVGNTVWSESAQKYMDKHEGAYLLFGYQEAEAGGF